MDFPRFLLSQRSLHYALLLHMNVFTCKSKLFLIASSCGSVTGHWSVRSSLSISSGQEMLCICNICCLSWSSSSRVVFLDCPEIFTVIFSQPPYIPCNLLSTLLIKLINSGRRSGKKSERSQKTDNTLNGVAQH